jgi:hypothetical protein
MLAARVSVVVGGNVEATTKVRAVWTDDEQLSTRLDRRVSHYTGQAELADAIAEALEARRAGDRSRATERFGRAAQLAAESRNEETLRLLQRVVDMDDPATGVVRVHDHLDDLDEMALDTRSTRTVPISQSNRSERPVPAPQQESAAAPSR